MEHWHEERIDEATGLLNQRSLVALLQDVLNQPISYSGLSSALVVMQLQESAKLYKELGPEKYTAKIKCLGELLQKGFGLRSSAARIEDDLFVILIPSLHSPEKAAQLSQSCRKKAEETLGLELCVGIAPQVDSYEDSIIWINDARTALKQAKDGGGQQAFLSQTMQMHSIAMWRMESDLELALKERQLETWYQPIVRLKDRTIAGYEALCRWTHPDRGPISPAEFIPVAENDGGLILEIGNFTLTESCKTLANIMERDGNDGLFMSVNLSAVQLLKDRRLTHYLEDALRKANIPPQQLKLEVTETAMMHQREQAIEALNRIKETGAQISLDDFGTGYSSLAYLKDFPISTLKIDRAFVSSVDSNKESQSILQTIAELGKSLNLDIVAEGIETEGELEILMTLGCEYGQGWLFSKPLPASDL
ncbi:MAG: GGDEF domain-containing phosphodiesterase [Planctomycetes bacterium]|nr:GGDEF domain-containing phosphodiesterase [Planctomycetota bacterium]